MMTDEQLNEMVLTLEDALKRGLDQIAADVAKEFNGARVRFDDVDLSLRLGENMTVRYRANDRGETELELDDEQ